MLKSPFQDTYLRILADFCSICHFIVVVDDLDVLSCTYSRLLHLLGVRRKSPRRSGARIKTHTHTLRSYNNSYFLLYFTSTIFIIFRLLPEPQIQDSIHAVLSLQYRVCPFPGDVLLSPGVS